MARTIIFSKDFYLNDVLFIPNFKYNLIAVSKLTADLLCQLMFTKSDCLVQDQLTLRKIGAASVKNGLYALDGSINISSSSVVNSVNVEKNNIWHVRLGHPCLERMNKMK
jgi:hypothetical protein